MKAREWKCRCPEKHKQNFLGYLRKTGVHDVEKKTGFLGHSIMERYFSNDMVEIVLTSYWESLESMTAYSGKNINKAVLYPEDDIYKIEPDEHVTIYDVIETKFNK